MAILGELDRAGKLHTDVPTVHAKTMKDALDQWDIVRTQDEAVLAQFAQGYDAHIRSEEEVVYPAARALLEPQALQAMGQEMRQRRGAMA